MTKRSKDSKRIREEMKKKRIRPERATANSGPSRRRKGRGRVKQVSMDELKEEYSYVLKDLRRIFLLALAMFALLITANIVYPLVFG